MSLPQRILFMLVQYVHAFTVAQNLILRKLQCVRTYVMGHDAYVLQCGTVASLVAMETYTCLSWYSRI